MPRHLERTKLPAGGAIDVEELKRKSWPGFAVEYVRLAAPTTYAFRTAEQANYVSLMNFYRTDGETKASGLPTSTAKDLRNKLTFVPSGSSVEGWCQVEKPGTIVTVTIEPQLETGLDLSGLGTRIEFEDQMLRWVLLRFQAILNDPAHDVPGYAETLVELLAFDLHRVAASPNGQPAECNALSANQLHLVVEYIDNHLNEKTTIAELAALVDLTRFHFIRSFKRTVGLPPHQYVIQRRVDRAKELLEKRERSIAEVAAITGFGSPIQLTRAFRRIVGTTPSTYRRDVA